MKTSAKEKNELASIRNRAKQIEEWISDIEDRNTEMMAREEERDLSIRKK